MSEPIKVFITGEQWQAYLDELNAKEVEEEEDELESSDVEFLDDSDVEIVDDDEEFVGFAETSEEDTDWTDSDEDFIET
jgi:hypothetical protein